MSQAQEEQQQKESPIENSVEDLKKLIIVTGFGPFVGHETVNASWEAVRLLPDVVICEDLHYKLEKLMIPVEYAAVDAAVEAIWKRRPELVIHCGVHGRSECVRIEKLAYNHNFKRADYAGKRLPRATAKINSDGIEHDVIHCKLNVEKMVAVVANTCGCEPSISTAAADKTVAIASNDVGNYLCGYIYLKSLDRDKQRSLFVHVPPINKPFSSAQTSQIVHKIIEECVRQLQQDMPDSC